MANERKVKVLVSGAGAAGQSVGYWLARHGFETTVVEQAPAPRIGLRNRPARSGSRGGRPHGYRGRLPGSARPSARDRSLDAHGNELWKTDGNWNAGGTDDIEILRDDLTSLLHSARESVDGLNYRVR